MYHGVTPKQEYPVTMVRVAGVEENAGMKFTGWRHGKLDRAIVLELTVRYIRVALMRKGLNGGAHFEAIYAENQHCDARGHTRAVKGVGAETGMFV